MNSYKSFHSILSIFVFFLSARATSATSTENIPVVKIIASHDREIPKYQPAQFELCKFKCPECNEIAMLIAEQKITLNDIFITKLLCEHCDSELFCLTAKKTHDSAIQHTLRSFIEMYEPFAQAKDSDFRSGDKEFLVYLKILELTLDGRIKGN